MAYTGKHFQILIGKESAWGTPVACTKDIGLVQNLTINDDNTLQRIFGASQRNASEIVAGNFVSKFNGEVNFQHGRLLEYALGTVAHDATDTPDIKHTFTEADTLPSFTMEDGYNSTADTTLAYAGCKLGSLELAVAMNDVIKARFDGVAKTVATGTSAGTAVVSTLPTFPVRYCSLTTGTDGGEAAITNMQSFNFKINNDLESLFGAGSRLAQDVQSNERQYEFGFTAAFSNKTEYELFLGGSAPDDTGLITGLPSMVFTATNGIAAASGLRKLVIDLNTCKYQSFRKPSSYKGWIYADFVGWATSLNSLYTYDNISSATF